MQEGLPKVLPKITMGFMVAKTRKKPPAAAGRRVHELDDMNVPGNAELAPDDEGVSIVLGHGQFATLEPASFKRLDRHRLAAARELMQLVGRRRHLAMEIEDLVLEMREHGVSWGVIGWCVGTTSEAARQRWGGEL